MRTCKSTIIIAMVVIICALYSCKTVSPMQTSITNRMPDKEASIPKYQYYVSRNIVLTLNEEYSNSKSTVTGGVARFYRESVQISKSTPGIVPKSVVEPYGKAVDGRLKLGIAFEEDDNMRIWFIQDNLNSQSKFHFEWDNEEQKIVKYGDAYYNVSWVFDGGSFNTRWKAFWLNFRSGWKGFWHGTNLKGSEEEDPYLIIKSTSKDELRGAKGRTVQ
jgi:hypothetical protein